jgi:hypothetical protein
MISLNLQIRYHKRLILNNNKIIVAKIAILSHNYKYAIIKVLGESWELFISGIFHLIFSDHRWQWVTEVES